MDLLPTSVAAIFCLHNTGGGYAINSRGIHVIQLLSYVLKK